MAQIATSATLLRSPWAVAVAVKMPVAVIEKSP
jgi:hypothetical protein